MTQTKAGKILFASGILMQLAGWNTDEPVYRVSLLAAGTILVIIGWVIED